MACTHRIFLNTYIFKRVCRWHVIPLKNKGREGDCTGISLPVCLDTVDWRSFKGPFFK